MRVCQMTLQEEDNSPSLMLQEQRKGEIQLTAKRKKDFFLVSPAKKGFGLAKRNEKVGQIFGMVLRFEGNVRMRTQKICVIKGQPKLAFKGNLCQNTKECHTGCPNKFHRSNFHYQKIAKNDVFQFITFGIFTTYWLIKSDLSW